MKSIKKTILIILILTLTFSAKSQTKFADGFNAGYKKGYCHNKGASCISPIPPLSPLPSVNQSMDSYQDGYDSGFAKGLEDGKSNKQSGRKRYKTTSADPIDYSQPESSDVTKLKVALYQKLYPQMIEDFQNNDYYEVIKKGNSLINVNLKTASVCELMGASYCNLKNTKMSKKYLKQALRLGSPNAKQLLRECVKTDKNTGNFDSKLSMMSQLIIGYNRLVNDNFSSNYEFKGGGYGDVRLSLFYDFEKTTSIGIGLSFLQSFWHYDLNGSRNLQQVNTLRLPIELMKFDAKKKNFISSGIIFGKTVHAQRTSNTFFDNEHYFDNFHTSILASFGSYHKFKNRYILISPFAEYQLNKHYDFGNFQANMLRAGVRLCVHFYL